MSITWKPVRVRLRDLRPWERNPRRMSKRAAERLLRSWREFGQVQTIAIGPNGEVYDGHQRLSALLSVHGPDYDVLALQASRPLTEAERERLVLMLHAGALGEWDWDALANWDAEALLEGGLDDEMLEALNRDAAALGELLASLEAEEDAEPLEDPGAQVDKAEELREKWGVEPGQLWRIPSRTVSGGEHRIICGDATDPQVVARVMQGEGAAMVFTDPPYAIYGSSTGVNADVADAKMVIPFFREVGKIIRNATPRFAHAYICCDWRSYPVLWQALRDAGLTVKNVIIWDKGMGLGSMYANSYEMVVFAVNHHQKTLIKGGARDAGHRQVHDTNIWRINREKDTAAHNAQKPLELVERAMKNSSDEGDIVLDPFLGSGTTLVACERLGRLGRGVEIEPKYVAVALERLAQMGLEPELVEK